MVVDTDETATKLFTVLNQERSGRCTFIPLNRIKPTKQHYPNISEAVPLITKIKGDAKFEKAFSQVFGKAMICQNLEVAASIVQQGKFNAVTIEGNNLSTV